MSGALRWVVAALLGLALAVALTLAVLQLTGRHVGLAGEPPSAGRGLVPTGGPSTTIPRTVTVTTSRAAPPPDDRGNESEDEDDD